MIVDIYLALFFIFFLGVVLGYLIGKK